MSAEVAIRMDTEDFLTPESDAALEAVLDALGRHGAAATFPLVAEKLRSWERRGRRHLVARLAGHAVGYHSNTHSVHPTIAEELAALPWAEARAAFAAREASGFAEVSAACGVPACWTQPGGNWTAAALPVLRGWGVPMEFSEGWNSYLDFGGLPCRYGGLLHWSPPVCAPKPFLSALPAAGGAALAQVRGALEAMPADGPPVCVVAHPTELCTSAFWDAVNFGGGRRPAPAEWRPAPLRPAAEAAAAADAFGRYVGELRAMGVRFVTARDFAARHPDRAPGTRLGGADVRGIAACARAEASWAVSGNLALSAAEVFAVLCSALGDGRADPVAVRPCDGPPAPCPEAACRPVDRAELRTAARWCDRFVEEHGHVPAAIPLGRGAAAPADFLAAAARAVLDPEAERVAVLPAVVAGERYVKAPDRLHWDWPVFAAGFAPTGLWVQARLQAWTLKPAPRAAAGPGAAPWRGAPVPVTGRRRHGRE